MREEGFLKIENKKRKNRKIVWNCVGGKEGMGREKREQAIEESGDGGRWGRIGKNFFFKQRFVF